jgi:hypothetical protein
LGYLGLSWASKLTGTGSSERVHARVFFNFFVKIFELKKKSFFSSFFPKRAFFKRYERLNVNDLGGDF